MATVAAPIGMEYNKISRRNKNIPLLPLPPPPLSTVIVAVVTAAHTPDMSKGPNIRNIVISPRP